MKRKDELCLFMERNREKTRPYGKQQKTKQKVILEKKSRQLLFSHLSTLYSLHNICLHLHRCKTHARTCSVCSGIML